MKIGIDARFYGPRVGGGGIGRYVAELVTHLQELDQENEYIIFLKKENFHECKITNPNFYKKMVDVHWYGLKEQMVMPREVRLSKVDFMHYPHWNIPLFSRVPFIVTVHDLILIEDKHSARSSTRNKILHGFKYAIFRTVLENAIHRSKHILTVSSYSKEAILKHFGIRQDKITVTPNGIIPALNNKNISLTKMGVYEPYFLYVGNAYPHKNLETMLEAFADFSEKIPYVQLVIAGRRDMFSKKLEKYARELGVNQERLRFIDLPSDDEISALYRSSNLFIYPSKLEGFGMPPLEAMSYGTPVAAAFASSLPEVLGSSAHYFNPEEADQLEKIMIEAIKNPELIRSKVEAGKEQVKKFTWKNLAEKNLAEYKKMR